MRYAATPKLNRHKLFLIFSMLAMCIITISVVLVSLPSQKVAPLPIMPTMGAEMFGPTKPEPAIVENPLAPDDIPVLPSVNIEPVPESAAVEDSYFDDALFIGNSLTEGIHSLGIIKNATVYASTGITVSEIFDKPIVKTPNGKITVLNALSKNKFGKIYVMLGMNELGWRSTSVFISKYETLLGEIHKLQPDAILYVTSILPVSAARDETDATFNNTRVAMFNECIRQVCANTSVNFVDCASAVMDADGKMPAEASPDGIHMNKRLYAKWYDYIKTHTIQGA